MTITAASLEIAFTATGVAETSRAIDQMNQKVERTSAAGKAAGAGLLAAGAAGLAGFAKGLSLVTDFESRMSGLGAVTGLTGAQLGKLDALALEIGKNTSFSASTAADALAELAKAGVGVEDILRGAGVGATDLAAAAGVEVPEAARLMSNALNIFRLTGDQASHVADVFAAASNKSAADVHELGLALAASGTVASQFGLGLEETVGALALFADFGLRSSDAGTSLKTALLSLLTPTDGQAKLMNRLNISFFDAQGNFIGLEALAGTLQDRMAGLTQEQRQTALSVLFGSDAIRAASILYSAGAGGVAEYTGAVDDSGAAADMAAARLDNLAGDLEELSGSAETVAIKFLRFAQGPLRQLVQQGTAVLNWLGDLNPQMQQMIAIGGLLASVVAALAGGWALFGDKILLAIRGFALLTPPLLLATGLVAGLFLAWRNNWGGIQDIVKRAVDVVGQTLGRMSQFFQAAKERGLEPFRLAMRTLIVGLGERLGDNHPVIAFLKGVLRNGERLAGWLTRDFIPTIQTALSWLSRGKFKGAGILFRDLADDLRGGWDRTIGAFLVKARDFAPKLLRQIHVGVRAVDWDTVGDTVGTLLQDGLSALSGFGSWVLGMLTGEGRGGGSGRGRQAMVTLQSMGLHLLGFMRDRLRETDWAQLGEALLGGIGRALTLFFDFNRWRLERVLLFGGLLIARFREVNWDAVGTTVQTGLQTALGQLGGWLIDRVRGINWDAVRARLALGASAAMLGITTAAQTGLAALSQLGVWVQERLSTVNWDIVKDALGTAARTAFFAIVSGAKLQIQTLVSVGTWVLEQVRKTDWEGIKGELATQGGALLGQLQHGMQDAWNNTLFPWLQSAFPALLHWLTTDGLPGVVAGMVTGGADLIGGLVKGLTDNWVHIAAFFTDVLLPGITGLLLAGPTLLIAAGIGIIRGLLTGLQQVWDSQLGPWLTERKGALLAFFAQAATWLLQKGQDILTGLLAGIQRKSNEVMAWFDGIGDAIGQQFAAAATWLVERGREVIEGIQTGAAEKWLEVQTWIAGRKKAIQAALPNPLTILSDTGRSIMQGLWNGFSERWRQFTGWFQDQIDKLPKIPLPGDDTAGESRRRSGPQDPNVPQRAFGGPVWAGRAYWVGEREPELFVPRVSGHVYTGSDVARMTRQSPTGGATGSAASGGTVVHQTNYITMTLSDVQEMVEAARFVRDLDQTRTLYRGAT